MQSHAEPSWGLGRGCDGDDDGNDDKGMTTSFSKLKERAVGQRVIHVSELD